MKHNFFFDFIIFKIFVLRNFFINFLFLGIGKGAEDQIGVCKIDNAKNSCLNNIIIFESTNGDIYLKEADPAMVFGTTFSNLDQRAFYAFTYQSNRYIIENEDDNFVPFLIKNISRSENKGINNVDLWIYKQTTSSIIIFLFGTDDFYIELLKINRFTNDFILVSPNDFISDENKVIKGVSSLFYIINNNLVYGTVTMTKNNMSDYYISLYGYTFGVNERNGNKLNFNYQLKDKIEFDDIKGKYLSCFAFNNNKNHSISCFYLNKDNNYTINLIQIKFNKLDEILSFSLKEKIIVGSPSDPYDTNFYFLKAISLTKNYSAYMYYSGNSNDIPTLLFKTIDNINFTLSDTYSNFPVIYLNEKYEFNNGIKYNDLSFFSQNQIYFVSSSKNKEIIIIAYLYFYSSSKEEEINKLVIRYYTLELKKYYNMKVFHGLKTAIFNFRIQPYLSLGFDFCYSNNSSNGDEMISNAGFILFSYPNVSLPMELDFIEYAFNNNKNYIIIDLMEDTKIENNIFGYKISSIYADYEYIEGVKYILVNSGEILEQYEIYQNDSVIKIVLEDGYSIDANLIYFSYKLVITPSGDINEINEYCDKINDVYGDKKDNNSYSFESKNSIFNSYEFYIYEDLETICNDSNCILCLREDINYCIVCKGNYNFTFGDEYMYKKKKICEEVSYEINSTDNFSNVIITLSDTKKDELTNSEKFNTEKLTYNKEITNEKYLLTDYESSITKKTNEITYKTETDSNNNQKEILTDSNTETNKVNTEVNISNTEANTVNTEEINKKNFSDIYKDELTNIIEEKNDIITNKISIENKNINESVNTLSYNIYSEEINDELSENNKITDMNSFETSNDIYKEKISNIIETSINSDTNKNLILSDYDSTSNKSIINTEKLSYINNISTDNLLSNKYNTLITNILTNNNKISIEELMNDKFKDINLSKEQLQKLYEDIKEYIMKEYNGDNIILNTSNVKIQISNIDAQKYSEELSNIDLGECGEILKEKYCKNENDSLIMLKFDIKPENETSTYVQYEIYDSLSGKFLKLEECSENKISIDAPIELDPEIEGLYKWLIESGYNLFDPNDTFYNDICATFTTQNDTDILLYDRRMDIYQATVNISLCQEGCDFQSYNALTKKVKCDCSVQSSQINTDMSELKFDKNEMLEQFYETLDNSNFRVLRCYKLIFNYKILKRNIGCIIMTILLALFEILIILYLIIGTKKVSEFIQTIIRNKYFPNDNNSSKNKLIQKTKKFENINKNSKKYDNTNNTEIKNKKNLNRKISNEKKKTLTKKNKRKTVTYDNNLQLEGIRNITKKRTCLNINRKMKIKGVPPKRRNTFRKKSKKYEESNLESQLKLSSKKTGDFPISQDNSINLKNLNEKNNPKLLYERKDKKKKSKINKLNIFKKNNYNKEVKSLSKSRKSTMVLSTRRQSRKIYKEKDLDSYKNNKKKKSFDKKEKLKEEFNNLNVAELNKLEYKKAILLDKRTYWQYYCSLLKKKHLILFTFLPTNDYNVMSLKVSLFLVSFSLYLNVNAFFFNDDTMHKIYEENGVFNIIAQIPKILYSSLISSFINMILKALSLSERDILKIKEEKSMVRTVKKSKKIEKCIRIKFVFFFLISLILMSFFWYFISCFCAVYINTQAILFKDSLISFGISMVYPIGINLIPGIFRIPSLRAKNKDKECMYSFSQIIALI